MSIKRVTQAELPWVNQQYEHIGFQPSSLDNEIIAIVMSQDDYAGIGRLVKLNDHEAELGGIYILDKFRGQSLAHEIVTFLVEESKRLGLDTVYCIPFEELQHFYKRLFKKSAFDHEVNQEVTRHRILNSPGTSGAHVPKTYAPLLSP
ncbi:GNAT family N-acetyltransferase [Paenibacillus sp. FSL W8-0187]|uniref:GNAT family N-acetyltransferase n=1 Tax=Paenibacillus TaxID=44249 RepID=UPI0030D9D2AF